MKKNSFRGSFFLKFFCVLVCALARVNTMQAEYWQLRVKAVLPDGSPANSFVSASACCSAPEPTSSDFTMPAPSGTMYSGQPDTYLRAATQKGEDFVGWFSDEACTQSFYTNMTGNAYGSRCSVIARAATAAEVQITTLYAKFTPAAMDWSGYAEAPVAGGKYYLYGVGYGGLAGLYTYSDGKVVRGYKDPNQAVLFTISDATSPQISCVDEGVTKYVNENGTYIKTTLPPAKTLVLKSDGTYMVNLNNGHSSGYTWWEMKADQYSPGSCTYSTINETSATERWLFIPEAAYNAFCTVESLAETGSISIDSTPTASGSTTVKFNVSEIGPVDKFEYMIEGGDGNFVLGTPTRNENVISVPVTYTAQNVHSGTSTPVSTATVRITAKNPEASTATGLVPVYVNLSPQFALNTDALDWSYDANSELIETYYVGAEVAASQRDRLQNKLIYNPAQTTGVAANYATWTATIVGDDASQFKFANGTQTVSGPYTPELLDVIFAPTETGEFSATLHVETSYTDANSVQLKCTKDISLYGKGLEVSMITFEADADQSPSDDEHYPYGEIIGTNSKDVSVNLFLSGITGATKVWSDPDGVFVFDESTIDFSKTNQMLTFRAHRTTPVTAATNHTATLTISGTGTEGPVSAVLTLTYQAMPLLTPEVTWNWASITESTAISNPLTTTSDGAWTLTKLTGDKVTYNAETKTGTVPYLHHEPATATFAFSVAQTDTYAAMNETYTATVSPYPVEIHLTTNAQFNDPAFMYHTSWETFDESKHEMYVDYSDNVDFYLNGHSLMSFSYHDKGTTTWTITEFFSDDSQNVAYNGRTFTEGFNIFSFNPTAVKLRIRGSGSGAYFTDVRFGDNDTITVDYDKVVLINDNGTIHDLAVTATFANTYSATVSLNAAAQPYFELRSAGKESGASIVFDNNDLGLGQIKDKVITITLKEGADAAAAAAATAGNACQVIFGDNYTYNHHEFALPVILMDAYDVTFKHNEHGSYTVTYEDDTEHPHSVTSADFVKHLTSIAPEHTRVTISAPTPASGYAFQGWKINDIIVSCKNSITKQLDEAATVEPVFSVSNGTFKIDDALFSELSEALGVAGAIADQEPVVVLMKDLALTEPATYTIPAKVTLLIPYKADFNELQEDPEIVTTATILSAYRTLTLKEGVNIVCNGNICVSGKIMAAGGGNKSAYTTGECGVINMATGGHIELNNGAHLYCWGYIKGQDMDQGNNRQDVGTIMVNNGAIVHENFELGDWRGGTATSNIYFEKEEKMLFPFQSYALQNVEIPTTYMYGSKSQPFMVVNTGYGAIPFVVSIIGSEESLFLLKDEQSVIRKWYDPTTDLSCFELNGTAQLDQLILNLPFVGDFASGECNLPISNSMHILLANCDMTLSKPLTVQAGAIIEITNTATVNLTAKIHLFDVDEWGLYIHNYYFRSFNNLTSHKNRGAENSKAGLDDAKFIIDGTLNVVNGQGYIYSTAGGADLMGNGGGVINFLGALPDASEIWQVNVLSGSPYITWVSTPETAANLHNEDGSYTKSEGFTSYYNIHGRWFYENHKDPLEDHTYDFYYLDNGNSGDEEWAAAIYSHDKTGLTAGMKWFNVVRAADNCTDVEEDLEKPFVSNWWLDTIADPKVYYNYTMLNDWHQFQATEEAGVYSGSNNVLYQKDGCEWVETGSVDENCLYTFYEGGYPVKKALVEGHFISLTSNGYDPAYYHEENEVKTYYICFQGCNWHEATPYVGESKAYTIVAGGTYIWFHNDWLNVEREEPFFYTADEVTNVKTYYEYVNGEWEVATPFVRVTDALETREFYMIHEAFTVAALKKNATITILRDIPNVTSSLVFSTQNTTCTLDLNGHTVTGAINKLITINAPGSTFTIKSTVPGGVLKMTGKPNNTCYYNVYVNAGNLVLEENATIAVDNPDTYVGENYALCAVRVLAGTSFTMNGGAISALVHRRAYGIESNGTTTLNAGTITCQTLAYAYPYGVQVKAGTTTIKDGVTITCTAGSTYAHPVMQTGGTLTVTGGTFRSYVTTQTSFSGAIRVDGGTANISNATLYAEATGTGSNSKNAYGVYSKGTTTLTNCTVKGITKSSAGYGVEVAGGTTTIVSGSYKGKTAGVHKSSGTLSIQGGYYSHNTNLSGNLAANRGVFETNDTEKAQYGSDMNYKVLEAYTITFMNGENQLQSGVQAKGTTPTYSGAEPTKAATELATYAFDGWSLTNDGDLLGSLPTVTAAATYYAHFTVLEGKYKVTFDATTNGGTTDIANSYIVEGEAVGTLPTATKTGYTFNGWFTEATGGEEITSATIPTESVTYYAQFTVNTYTLTWNLEGGSISVAGTPAGPVAYGTALTAPTVTKTGYTFVTWTPTVAATMPAAAATYTASWTPKTNTAYKVIHKLQNPENLEEYIVDATENLSGTTGAYVAPKPKTTYVGYITPDEVAPTQILADGSLEIIYLYDCISYTITFDATTNGGECGTASLNVLHGATLTLPEATRDGYTFDGWFTKAVGGDQITNSTVIQRNIGTLYAQFTEAITPETNIIAGKSGDADGVDVVITESGVVAHSLIIEKDGRVNITPSASVEIEDFILESNGALSGQLLGDSYDRLTITGHAYFDLTLNTQNRTWYAVAVPWEVNAESGISIKGGRTLVLGRDFDLVYHDGSDRAEHGKRPENWKYVEYQTDKIMHPGRLYMMYFASNIETLRFTAVGTTIYYVNATDPVSTYDETTGNEGHDANWNGIANPAVYHAKLSAGGATHGYILTNGNMDEYLNDPTIQTYTPVQLSSYAAIVGRPFFIQAGTSGDITVTPNISVSSSAPRRRVQGADAPQGVDAMYELTFRGAGKSVADNMFIQMDEEKADRYVIVKDLVKAGVNAKCPQMWVARYGDKLALNTTASVDGVYSYPLGINIPQAGEYTIAIKKALGETESLYLTYEGEAIWNLSNGSYTGTFDKGETNAYGLRTAAKAPQTATGIEEAVVDAHGETMKVLINDKVYIIRGNKVYSIDGQLVK